MGTRDMKRKTTKIHRKIYEDYYQICLLPYIEIHHVDGNHKNNHNDNDNHSVSSLGEESVVQIDEHYHFDHNNNKNIIIYCN